MSDPVRSPSVASLPGEVVQILVDVLLDVPERDRPHPETAREIARGTLSQQLPKLYAHWAEGLVAKIRSEGFKDAAPNEGYDGPLHEAISDAAGSYSSEFWPSDRVVEGVADYVADLLGLGDRSS